MRTDLLPQAAVPGAARRVHGRITVVTAVYNAAPTLRRCIESVLGQDYPEVEHLLMDGGSTDGSIEILKSYGDRIVWRSERDKGIFDAWNKALDLATGEWIAFVGADDVYLPGALRAYMNAARGKDVEYISSQVRWVPPRGRARIIGQPWAWPAFQRSMTTAHVGSLHRYDYFERYGRFELAYPIVADYEMLLRAGPTLRTAFVPALTVEMQGGGNSDRYTALDEQFIAKVKTGGRARLTARIELWTAYAKRFVRGLLTRLESGGGQ